MTSKEFLAFVRFTWFVLLGAGAFELLIGGDPCTMWWGLLFEGALSYPPIALLLLVVGVGTAIGCLDRRLTASQRKHRKDASLREETKLSGKAPVKDGGE